MVYIYYNTIIGERKRKLHQRLAFPYEKFVTESKPERSTIMKLEQALAAVKGEKAAELFMEMYGADGVEANVERYSHVAQGYVDTFGEMKSTHPICGDRPLINPVLFWSLSNMASA